MGKNLEAILTYSALGIVTLLVISFALASSGARDSALPLTDAERREMLRPKGDFREQVRVGLALLQIMSLEERRCTFAHKFAHLFYWMNEGERRAIDDDMIAKLSDLLDHDTFHGTHKCLSYVIGGIFVKIGPRAVDAVPSLEQALTAAELDRSARVSTSAECAGFEFNPDRRLDNILRWALVRIDGRQRERKYALKCPPDADP